MTRCLFLLLLMGRVAFAHEAIEEKPIPFFEDEVSLVSQLIETQEKKLVVERSLRDKMRLFQKQKQEFVLGNQTKSHAFIMVSNAREILSLIKQEHLSYLFPSDYLEELVFFSSIAGKAVPLKP